jgi:long-chain acyl-CoA synthetase
VRNGDRVAIFAEPSLDWVTHFFAVMLAGGIAVPLDNKLGEGDLGSIVRHCEPKVILTSTSLRDAALKVRHLIRPPVKVLSLQDPAEFQKDALASTVLKGVDRSQVALICYTSGTLGAPKGVEITAETLFFQAEALYAVSEHLQAHEVMLSILPLNHLFGLSSGVLYCMHAGIEHLFPDELTQEGIRRCLQERSVTQLLAVPLYVKMVMNQIREKVRTQKGPKGEMAFDALLKSARAMRIGALKNYLFNSIHSAMGGHLRRFICGGSSLDSTVAKFFKAVNIPVYLGYGLTETGPVIAVNVEAASQEDSVGKPLPGVEVKIVRTRPEDVNGEIWTKGPHVMRGYHRAPELTAKVLDKDGWFRTGDLGHINKNGYLFIRGRKKTLIVLSSGKKIYPEEVESVLARSELIKNVCVLGVRDSKSPLGEVVTAVVLPSDQLLQDLEPAKLQKRIEVEVAKLCEPLAPYKRPGKVLLRMTPFAMTSSLKIKRDVLMKELEENAS